MLSRKPSFAELLGNDVAKNEGDEDVLDEGEVVRDGANNDGIESNEDDDHLRDKRLPLSPDWNTGVRSKFWRRSKPLEGQERAGSGAGNVYVRMSAAESVRWERRKGVKFVSESQASLVICIASKREVKVSRSGSSLGFVWVVMGLRSQLGFGRVITATQQGNGSSDVSGGYFVGYACAGALVSNICPFETSVADDGLDRVSSLGILF